MITTADPRTDGTLASLRRPDANLSGLCQVVPLGSKQLELLKDAAPDLERVAVLWNSSKPAQAAEWTELQNSAAALGVSLHSLIVTRADELVPALADASAGGAQRLVVLNDFLFFSYRAEIIAAAAAQRLPAVYPNREYVAVGGLMSYGPSLFDMHRRAAWYVVRALNGAQLAELPVEGPAHFELALNLPAARAQEVTFPRALLRDASHIFE